MKNINLRGSIFDYPESQDVDWGDEATTYASALADTINRIAPTTDILETSVNLIEDSNWNIIAGLRFDSTKIQAADVTLVITRSGGSVTGVENFNLKASFNTVTSAWEVTVSSVGNTDVDLDVDAGGQVKYMAQPSSSTIFTARYRLNGFA